MKLNHIIILMEVRLFEIIFVALKCTSLNLSSERECLPLITIIFNCLLAKGSAILLQAKLTAFFHDALSNFSFNV